MSFSAPVLEPIKNNSQAPIENLNQISDPQLVGVIPGKVPRSHIRATFSTLVGDLGQDSDTENQTALGISYAYDFDELKAQEWQAHWTTEKLYWLQFSERRRLFTDTLYEPYYKYGLSFVGDPNDALSSFTRLDSYFGSAAVGILDVGQWYQLLTFEMGLSINIRGLIFHAQLGLQHSF
ncbi:MAG: hypothetical protein ACK5V3_02545 [Bdellovibrionales bacterium]